MDKGERWVSLLGLAQQRQARHHSNQRTTPLPYNQRSCAPFEQVVNVREVWAVLLSLRRLRKGPH